MIDIFTPEKDALGFNPIKVLRISFPGKPPEELEICCYKDFVLFRTTPFFRLSHRWLAVFLNILCVEHTPYHLLSSLDLYQAFLDRLHVSPLLDHDEKSALLKPLFDFYSFRIYPDPLGLRFDISPRLYLRSSLEDPSRFRHLHLYLEKDRILCDLVLESDGQNLQTI